MTTMAGRGHRAPLCVALAATALLIFNVRPAHADDWPMWLGPQGDGIWREKGIIEKFPAEGLPARWRTPVGMGYSGPAVAGGRVYVTDRLLPEGKSNPADAFGRDRLPGVERILCLDESTGKLLWKHEYPCVYQISYPAGPRTTPIVRDGKVYSLGAMGDLLCLDTESGKVLWSHQFMKEYDADPQTWGFSAHPLLDGEKLICLVGGPKATVVAYDRNSGKELWRSLNAPSAGYCPPVIFDVAGVRQLIIWEPSAIHGLDPETGKEYWSEKFLVRAGLTVPTPRLTGDLLFVTSFYNGSMLLRLGKGPDGPTAKVVWKGKGRGENPDQTDGLHSIMPTPFVKDGYIYGVCSYGELRCLKLETGERIWADLRATTSQGKPIRWANAFLIPHEEKCYLFNELGELILARLTPEGYDEIARTKIIEPSNTMPIPRTGRTSPVVWTHPAFADRCIFVRNDQEIICYSLAAQ